MPKIWDCFPFLDEFELLEARLALLNDTVDYWVIAQSDKTHRGLSKPLYLTPEHALVKAYGPQRFRFIDVREPYESPWRSEKVQRIALESVLNAEAKLGDVVILSDVDEMPDPRAVRRFVASGRSITSLPMRHCFVFPNLVAGSTWLHAKAFRLEETIDLNRIRREAVPPVVQEMGVHLTVRGDWVEAWSDKGRKTLHASDFETHAQSDRTALAICLELQVLPRRDAARYLGLPRSLPEHAQNATMRFLINDVGMPPCSELHAGISGVARRRSLAAAVSLRIPGAPNQPWHQWRPPWKAVALVAWLALAPLRWSSRSRRFLAYRGYRGRVRTKVGSIGVVAVGLMARFRSPAHHEVGS